MGNDHIVSIHLISSHLTHSIQFISFTMIMITNTSIDTDPIDVYFVLLIVYIMVDAFILYVVIKVFLSMWKLDKEKKTVFLIIECEIFFSTIFRFMPKHKHTHIQTQYESELSSEKKNFPSGHWPKNIQQSLDRKKKRFIRFSNTHTHTHSEFYFFLTNMIPDSNVIVLKRKMFHTHTHTHETIL